MRKENTGIGRRDRKFWKIIIALTKIDYPFSSLDQNIALSAGTCISLVVMTCKIFPDLYKIITTENQSHTKVRNIRFSEHKTWFSLIPVILIRHFLTAFRSGTMDDGSINVAWEQLGIFQDIWHWIRYDDEHERSGVSIYCYGIRFKSLSKIRNLADAVAYLVETLCYKPQGRGIGSGWGWFFQLT
jgi:hypothetical protein